MHIGIVSLFSCRLFDSSLTLRHGGAEVQIVTLAKALAGKGHQVSVFVFDLGQGEKEVNGLRVVPSIRYQPEANALRQVFEQRKLWAALKRHKPSHILMPGGTGILSLLTHYGEKHDADVYSVLMHDRDVAGAPLLKGLDQAGFKKGLKHCDGIVAQNAVQLEAAKAIKAHSTIIQPPIDSGRSGTVDKTSIIWVGRCVDWKQPGHFLTLAKKHPQHPFLMLLTEQDQPLLEKIKEASSTIPNLTIESGLSRGEVLKKLSSSQALISTSVSEGFPTVFLEAMTQSCAILSLNSNPDDVLDKSGAGKAFNNNLDQLSHHLKDCLDDITVLKQYQESGERYVQKHHAPEIIASMYEEFLNNER